MNQGPFGVIFDVDGTLVDSQGDILRAMTTAFAAAEQAAPTKDDVLSIVGLSLDVAMLKLVPHLSLSDRSALVAGYKTAYNAHRVATNDQSSALYPYVRTVLDQLQKDDRYLLGVATGKSRRGLNGLIEGHALQGLFLTQQVSDDHPSKPHPAMLQTAFDDLGLAPRDCVMIGDTTFDMDMAQAAGCHAIGVSWGYHAVDALQGADHLITDMRDLPDVLAQLWE